ncbi:hypothetical protein YQE_05762, partial [Dendroctonus ponderosae]
MAKKPKSSITPEELEISNVTHEDEGWYMCIATNSLGSTTAKAYLTVVDVLPDRESNGKLRGTYGHKQKMFTLFLLGFREKRQKMIAIESARSAMITQWTKKVIIEKMTNTEDVSEPLTVTTIMK